MIVPVKTHSSLKLLFYWIFTKDENIQVTADSSEWIVFTVQTYTGGNSTPVHKYSSINRLCPRVLEENINKMGEFAKISGKFSKHTIQQSSAMPSVLVSAT